jgi:hypothetical protein
MFETKITIGGTLYVICHSVNHDSLENLKETTWETQAKMGGIILKYTLRNIV